MEQSRPSHFVAVYGGVTRPSEDWVPATRVIVLKSLISSRLLWRGDWDQHNQVERALVCSRQSLHDMALGEPMSMSSRRPKANRRSRSLHLCSCFIHADE